MQKRLILLATVLISFFVAVSPGVAGTGKVETKAKYVFLFIGDGMGVAQRNAAELYLAGEKGVDRPENAKLVMNGLPCQGMNTTYDLSSVIPDSASTATAIATGHKTSSGTIGMDPSGRISYENIAETARKNHWKVGILTTVSLDHATPAAFYAHVASRRQMYDISMQMVNSGFDYFAGGQFLEPVDRKDGTKPNAVEVARKNGYTVAVGRGDFLALKPGGGRVIAMSELVDRDAAMYYSLDEHHDNMSVSLAEYLAKGIELLDNPKGFFIIVEGGKIDWACHANDAAASIHDTLALDEAVGRAFSFYQKHPGETLIVVTGDHETGGMAIGFAGTQYSSFMDKIRYQNMSYIEFDKKINEYRQSHTPEEARLDDLMPLIKEAFGLYTLSASEKKALEDAVEHGRTSGATDDVKKAGKEAESKLRYGMAFTDRELAVLREAFKQSMLGEKERARDDYTYLLYGGYEPLSVKLTTILNNKAGLAWTSYSHTGVPVQTSAVGVGARAFNGYYDQTDIHAKLLKISGFKM